MIEKIFKAYDVRAVYPNPLDKEAAWKVGHATGQFGTVILSAREFVAIDLRAVRRLERVNLKVEVLTSAAYSRVAPSHHFYDTTL